MRRAAWVVAAALCVITNSALVAQPGANDESLMRRADSLTVGQYCRAATRIVADSGVRAALAEDTSVARASAGVICNPLLSSFSLLALTGRSHAPLSAVARTNTNVYRAVQTEVFDAMHEFRAAVRRPDVRPLVTTLLGADNAEFVRVAETAQLLLVERARDSALRRLANYERKLGPTSARLNLPETLVNYALQRFVPVFRPSPLGGPSPWEFVASYAPGYVTFDKGEKGPLPVSASEFGFRYYLFGDAFGKAGTGGLLRPSYFAFGILTASDRNGTLVWPWKGRDRSGGFVSWGAIKVGYIDRDRGTWLVSKQFQAIPFVF